ncbi:glycosyltransferase family 4 protein [Candidatus Woesearchaeota archaeon]|nr:glycosyltransferase family 4 protein [Candidatus Woesearchaeota archaeon]
MKIAIITPSYPPSVGGNATTASRLVEGLKSKGVKTKVFLPEQLKNGENIRKLEKFKPDLVHGFHAYKSGVIGSEVCRKLYVPLIITITGTDANINLFQDDKRDKLKEILSFAKKIVVFHKTMKEKITKEIPYLRSKIKTIKQTVKLRHKHCEIRKKLGIAQKDAIFFLPAAIRQIKYGNFYFEEFLKLNKKYGIKLILAGPVLDEEFAKGFFNKIKNHDWVYYIPKIPHDEIKCVFEDIDVSLNTSVTEGGMANAVLEAMSVGKPVLASAIEGNKSIIKNGFNGLIFENGEEFCKKAEKLTLDKKLREKIGKNAKIFIKKNFHYRDEINGYVNVYREALEQIKLFI